jgi:hypothetical protein
MLIRIVTAFSDQHPCHNQVLAPHFENERLDITRFAVNLRLSHIPGSTRR